MVLKMSKLIKLGSGDFILDFKEGKYDPNAPLEEQVQLRVVTGEDSILIKNFNLYELSRFPRKVQNVVEDFIDEDIGTKGPERGSGPAMGEEHEGPKLSEEIVINY
jgi:hypothetical protein